MRAYRSNVHRLIVSQTVEAETNLVERRISASFKENPCGQMLGSTYDYTHRLLDFNLIDEDLQANKQWMQDYEKALQVTRPSDHVHYFPKVVDYLREEGLFEKHALDNTDPMDITKESLHFPASRSVRLQTLTRGQKIGRASW